MSKKTLFFWVDDERYFPTYIVVTTVIIIMAVWSRHCSNSASCSSRGIEIQPFTNLLPALKTFNYVTCSAPHGDLTVTRRTDDRLGDVWRRQASHLHGACNGARARASVERRGPLSLTANIHHARAEPCQSPRLTPAIRSVSEWRVDSMR